MQEAPQRACSWLCKWLSGFVFIALEEGAGIEMFIAGASLSVMLIAQVDLYRVRAKGIIANRDLLAAQGRGTSQSRLCRLESSVFAHPASDPQ